MKKLLIACAMILGGCSIDAGKSEGAEKSSDRSFKKASFLPENNYHDRTYYQAGEVTEQDFNDVLYAAEEIYGPIVKSFGARLIVNGDFRSPTVNAYANQDGNDWSISFFGGLAKQNYMTLEGFTLVVCHELGHHLGFGVLYPDSPWQAAVEGQSDYFAAAACARKMFDPSSPLRFWGRDLMKRRNPNKNTNCNGFGIDKEICELTLQGALSLGKVLAELNNEPVPTFENMDRSKVRKTQYKHPKASCRLATYYGGAICNKSWPDEFQPNNVQQLKQNACFEYSTCWLNENNL